MESRYSARVPLTCKRYAALLTACLFLLLPPFSAAGRAQVDGPITKDDLLKMLRAGRETQSGSPKAGPYIKLIKKRGLDFRVKPSDARDIRKAGDYLDETGLKKLIAVARQERNYRPGTALKGNIRQVETDTRDDMVQVFILLSVSNAGRRPLIPRRYSLNITHTSGDLEVKVPDEESIGEDERSIKEIVKMEKKRADRGGGNVVFVIRPPDSLSLKTKNGVAGGAPVTGWLRFVVPVPLDKLRPYDPRRPGVQYIVSFTDSDGKRYEAVATNRGFPRRAGRGVERRSRLE